MPGWFVLRKYASNRQIIIGRIYAARCLLLALRLLLAVSVILLFASAGYSFNSKAKQALLIDAQTNVTLFAKAADEPMGPSSMTKLMTVYLLLEQLKNGVVSLEDEFIVSEKAWRKGGSKMFVEVGRSVKVDDLLRGIIVQSGNDACIVVAEALAGSEEEFAAMMNAKAKQLGLAGSHFTNSTGWPDDEHYMTARDLVKLAKALIYDFPEYYHYWAQREFTYNNITQRNRNWLLGVMGIDGLKTGHTEAAGYGIIISGQQQGRRLIAIVNGLQSKRERIEEAKKLIAYGFNNFANVTLLRKGQQVANAKSWLGDSDIPLVVADDIVLTLPKIDKSALLMRAIYEEPITAPVRKGQELAKLEINAPGIEPKIYPLYAGKDVAKLPPAARLIPILKFRLFGSY